MNISSEILQKSNDINKVTSIEKNDYILETGNIKLDMLLREKINLQVFIFLNNVEKINFRNTQ